jgi:tetratricopeptide (TPR) repeat protein
MSTDNVKSAVDKNKASTSKPVEATEAKPPQPKIVLPPLFRRIDWLAFGVTALLAFIGFYLTLAPEVTLEDSGELATGSFYAGVPHPPGYPLWTVFTWLFTVLVPVGNVAYRVAIASAVSGAVAAGLLALITSRGSSMMIESIPDFKAISRRVENAICIVSGFVAGMLLAFNGYMWSQSVIVEVYPFSVVSLMGVLCCLLRWVYAPHQKRYLYIAWFLFGVCFTNHQTLIVAAMGLEIAILAAQPKLGRDLLLGNSAVYLIGAVVLNMHLLGSFEPNDMVKIIFHIVGFGSILGCGWLIVSTKKIGTEILPVLTMFGLWLAGAAFYLYMPLSSMSNPPMNWGYPRTVEGFIHALSRGQYEKTNPTNFLNDPGRLINQICLYFQGAAEEFNILTLLLALIPFFFIFRVQKRERAWMIGLSALWACLAILLLILLNPAPDKASVELNRVFFTSSYTIISIFIGYGLTLTAAFMVTQYEKFRVWGLAGGAVAAGLALYSLADTTQHVFGSKPHLNPIELFFHAIGRSFAKNQYGLPIHAELILLGLALGFVLILAISRLKPRIYIALGLFALLPTHAILSHWSDNEQRGHWFGYWFGHDMFTPPFKIYPEMTRDAVLFGGTDPGRFCPTYMVFCESFTPHDKQPLEDQKFDRRDVYVITQNALADGTYLEYIRAHYNRSTQKDPPFFQELLRSGKEKELNYTTNGFARTAYQTLDKPFTELGARIEARRRKEGVYPPNEIYTPTPEDSQQCFQEYLADAQKRLDHDTRFPAEPKQIKPGEQVTTVDNRVQVSGQVAVMSINGLLTKVIFDHNPTNEFFVEESFPLDWMYPYLTPFGVIMKINRQPIPEFTDEIIRKDHEFWTNYSSRLIGNWITYDTSVQEIANFVEKVYRERDFNGFTGDRKFVRDDQAQKAFSKLRSSIGGIYNWRIANAKNPADQQRMMKEADFAFRQAFAFCPYSPEAVFRYVQLLAQFNRIDDAILVASTCHKIDPNNGAVEQLMGQLQGMKNQHGNIAPPPIAQAPVPLEQLEKESKDNPENFQAAFTLAAGYLQAQQMDKAIVVLDRVLANPKVNSSAVMFVARAYAEMRNTPKLETALEKLTQLEPNSPEAWYDLAAMKATDNKTNEAFQSLRHAMESNASRLDKDPKASNLLLTARADGRFEKWRQSPELRALLGTK